MALAFSPSPATAAPELREAELLECTLRDGSYAINYAFTAAEAAALAQGLEQAGVRWIEIGHGLGLGASTRGHGESAATDQEYCEAVDAVLTSARWGVFFIPGIGVHEELASAISAGLDFVRIGTNITECHQMEPFIRQALNAGVMPCANLMKSYAVTPAQFANFARQCWQMGAQVVSVVDSAGGMLPAEVAQYVDAALQAEPAMVLGFHGHNNLGLANANALAALDAGAIWVDSTLNGLGRSAGNAITESLVLVLERAGYQTGIDPIRIQDLGHRAIRPYLAHRGGIEPLDLTLGAARFHSSYLSQATAIAREYDLDARQLVLAVGAVDPEHPTPELMRRLAASLVREAASAGEYPARIPL